MAVKRPLIHYSGTIQELATGDTLYGASSGGASAFIGLTDAPTSYIGNSQRLVRVNSAETGLEFYDIGTGSITSTNISTAPTITGVTTANETQAVALTITNYNATSIYTLSVSGGSTFQSGATINWTMPQITASAVYRLTVRVTDSGKSQATVYYDINVLNLLTNNDSILTYASTTMSEFTTFNNASVVNGNIVAGVDTSLAVANNRVSATYPIEVADLITIDGVRYTVDSISLSADGSTNTSIASDIPSLTSNVSSSGTVIFDTEYSTGTCNPWKAFDGATSTAWLNSASSVVLNSFLGFYYTSPKIINKYLMIGWANATTASQASAPKSWIFQGSNDNTTWIDLHTVNNQTTWADAEERTFTFNNGNYYYYYRVLMVSSEGANYVGIVSLKFIEAQSVISSTTPTMPQFCTASSLLVKSAISNVINQDTIDTNFSGINSIVANYELLNIILAGSTTTVLNLLAVFKLGDILVIGNATDGLKELTITSTITATSINISSLSLTVAPTYVYRKDNKLFFTFGSSRIEAINRVDTLISVNGSSNGASNSSTTDATANLGASANITNSTEYSAGYYGYYCFDNTTGNSFLTLGTSGWVSYKFNTAQVINKYTIDGGAYSGGTASAPKDWTLQGSNDGTTWTVLDTKTNITTGWTQGAPQTFTFIANITTPYLYYKLVITANNGYAGYTAINEIQYIVAQAGISTISIQANYSDIGYPTSTRTIYTTAKLTTVGDKVSRITGVLQKL